MRNQLSSHRSHRAVALLLSVLLSSGGGISGQDRIEKYFIGIELNGILCGYSEVIVTVPQAGDTGYIALDQKTFISFRALGTDITQNQFFTYRLDPADGNFVYHTSFTEEGEVQTSATMRVTGDSLRIRPEGETATTVFLPENTILPNTMFYPHLKEDFGLRGLDSSTYRIFNVRNGKVEDFVYRKVGIERIALNDSSYDAVILEEKNPGTGLRTTYWIDSVSGLRLKMEAQNRVRMYLTDLSVRQRLRIGNFDELIFVRTNARIGDLRRISSMTVHADLDAIPVPGMDDLNVPGQSFHGSIADNSLKGLFEVNYNIYKGENALSLNSEHIFTADINAYLLPEELIQSDDPELRNLSLKLTEGSTDFWEATCRLSGWVAEHIEGSIYGGSALETLKRGNGSCGAQSMLLAALCRAAGLPARVVWGCIYTPEYGGSFGHHGWNEVYMGEAGWVPVDATIHEPDYVDSGHIRLGVLRTQSTVINFREMRIIDYTSR